MRFRMAMAGLALVCFASLGFAQTTTAADERMNQFEKRLGELEKKYQEQLKAKDEEIARLKAQQKPGATSQATSAAAQDEIDKVTRDILKDVQSRSAATQTLR